MSDVSIHRLADGEPTTFPAFDATDRELQRLRQRTLALFTARGLADRQALEEWIEAESDLGWPPSSLIDRIDCYLLTIVLSGFSASDIGVTVAPREIIVHPLDPTDRWSVNGSQLARPTQSLRRPITPYRCVELRHDIRVDDVNASMSNGVLSIVAPKDYTVAFGDHSAAA